jgi:hypothetical protein
MIQGVIDGFPERFCWRRLKSQNFDLLKDSIKTLHAPAEKRRLSPGATSAQEVPTSW